MLFFLMTVIFYAVPIGLNVSFTLLSSAINSFVGIFKTFFFWLWLIANAMFPNQSIGNEARLCNRYKYSATLVFIMYSLVAIVLMMQ